MYLLAFIAILTALALRLPFTAQQMTQIEQDTIIKHLENY